MGKDRQTTTQTTTPQATPEERALIAQQTKELQATEAQRLRAQIQGFDLVSTVFGGQELPGNLAAISRGLSPEAIGARAAQLGAESAAGFQRLGLTDSGVAFRETAEDIAEQVLLPAEQFNIQTLLNTLGLASGQQASLQGQIASQQQALGQQLAGLRPVTSVGTTIGKNPFISSFGGGFGETFGKGLAAGGFGYLGGGGSTSGKVAQTASNMANIAAMASAAGAFCWVASEIFGGWYHPKTCAVRNYIGNLAPKWFKNIYIKYGERFAKFISDKPTLKNMIKPLFEYFASKGESNAY